MSFPWKRESSFFAILDSCFRRNDTFNRMLARMREKMKIKSWREKLADVKGLLKVEKIKGKMAKRWGVTGTVVVPAPKET